MFSIHKISTASQWYYLSLVDYYLGRHRRTRRNRRGRAHTGDDQTSDEDLEPDLEALPLTDIDPYTIDTPGEPPGQWWGAGAAQLGLSGMVREAEYSAVFRGFHPSTRQPLVQNAGTPNRRAGWECCLTPPKHVAVIWSQMETADRQRMEEALRRAARKTLVTVHGVLALAMPAGTPRQQARNCDLEQRISLCKAPPQEFSRILAFSGQPIDLDSAAGDAYLPAL